MGQGKIALQQFDLCLPHHIGQRRLHGLERRLLRPHRVEAVVRGSRLLRGLGVRVFPDGNGFHAEASRDTRSKQAFLILRTLIGIRLDQSSAGQQVPVLTVGVGG